MKQISVVRSKKMLKKYPFLAGLFYANAVFIKVDSLKQVKAVTNFLSPFNFVFLGFFQHNFYTNTFWSQYAENKNYYLTTNGILGKVAPSIAVCAINPLLSLNNLPFTLLKNTLQKLLTYDNTKSIN